MAYVSRLLEDSGVSLSSSSTAGVALHESGHITDTPDVTGFEEVVTAANTGLERGAEAGRFGGTELQTMTVAAVEHDIPATPAAQHGDAADRATAVEVSAREERGTARATAGPAGRPPTETPEERVMRTMAAVREWTVSPIPSEAREIALVPGDSPELTSRRGDGSGKEDDASAAEVVIRSNATRPDMPANGVRDHRPASTGEPEVVNVNLSIGAIELTVEAPEPLATSPYLTEATHQGPAAPDAQSELRRHYIRPAIGGW
jgi:hypothetical protein